MLCRNRSPDTRYSRPSVNSNRFSSSTESVYTSSSSSFDPAGEECYSFTSQMVSEAHTKAVVFTLGFGRRPVPTRRRKATNRRFCGILLYFRVPFVVVLYVVVCQTINKSSSTPACHPPFHPRPLRLLLCNCSKRSFALAHRHSAKIK